MPGPYKGNNNTKRSVTHMRVTLLFFFTYYSLRARLLQIPGQQHGGSQGGQRGGLAAQDAGA